MHDSDFSDLCLDSYKQERDEADRLYTKLPLGISANVIIGGAIAFMLTGTYIDHVFTRVDAFLYYASALLATTSLIASSVFLVRSLTPRQYQLMSLPDTWVEWRKQAEASIRSARHPYTEEQVRSYLAEHTRAAIEQQICHVTRENHSINRRRTRQFVFAMWFTTMALIPVLLEGLFKTILWLQFR